jgi:hypothetical protein
MGFSATMQLYSEENLGIVSSAMNGLPGFQLEEVQS